MSDPAILRAAQAAAQSALSQPQQPAPQPPAAPPPQGGGQPPPQQPGAPAQPQPTAYVPPTGIARAIINGKPIDVPISELVAKYQMGTVAEQRLAEVNAQRNEQRQALETHARLASLRGNPQAFQEEAHKAFGLRPAQQAENSLSARIDPNEAPETTALRQEIAQLRAGYDELNQFRGAVVMQNVATQIRGAIQQFPLYQQNPVAAQRAETTAATFLANNQGANPVEIVGMVHAQDAEFLQSMQQQTRDQRAAAVQQFASVPPGTPSLAHAEAPRMTPEQMRRQGSSLSTLKGVSEGFKKLAGL